MILLSQKSLLNLPMLKKKRVFRKVYLWPPQKNTKQSKNLNLKKIDHWNKFFLGKKSSFLSCLVAFIDCQKYHKPLHFDWPYYSLNYALSTKEVIYPMPKHRRFDYIVLITLLGWIIPPLAQKSLKQSLT